MRAANGPAFQPSLADRSVLNPRCNDAKWNKPTAHPQQQLLASGRPNPLDPLAHRLAGLKTHAQSHRPWRPAVRRPIHWPGSTQLSLNTRRVRATSYPRVRSSSIHGVYHPEARHSKKKAEIRAGLRLRIVKQGKPCGLKAWHCMGGPGPRPIFPRLTAASQTAAPRTGRAGTRPSRPRPAWPRAPAGPGAATQVDRPPPRASAWTAGPGGRGSTAA